MKRTRAFTLIEMLLTLGLVALVYTMVSSILVQIARYVKDGRRVAQSRYELLSTVEDLRYQLRSLYIPEGDPCISGSVSTAEEWDVLRFLTTNGQTHKGVVEVGYQVRSEAPTTKSEDETEGEDEESNNAEKLSALYYREFRFRQRELRPLDEFQEAPWKVRLPNVSVFNLEYSAGSAADWKPTWDQPEPPQTIRILIKRGGNNHDEIVFEVTPGVTANRW